MLTTKKLSKENENKKHAECLYLTAFPAIERHPLNELYEGCEKGNCEWLLFTDQNKFIGMAYMILHDDIAFLLYLAVDDPQRNKGYGTKILTTLNELYKGKELILLIESLREKCDNKKIRIRRKGFYLRNGLHDTQYVQPCENGMVLYDILSTNTTFDVNHYMNFVHNYPLPTTMGEAFKAQ